MTDALTTPFADGDPVDPRGLIRDMDNILSVELTPDGDRSPMVIWTSGGRRYVADITLREVTDVPFYEKRGLFMRLQAYRAATKAD